MFFEFTGIMEHKAKSWHVNHATLQALRDHKSHRLKFFLDGSLKEILVNWTIYLANAISPLIG